MVPHVGLQLRLGVEDLLGSWRVEGTEGTEEAKGAGDQVLPIRVTIICHGPVICHIKPLQFITGGLAPGGLGVGS